MLAVPNFSVGADEEKVHAIASALEADGRVLDVHSDAAHDRSVFSLAGGSAELVSALAAAAQIAAEVIDMGDYAGAHPAIGALDVAPLVWLDESERPTAAAAARASAEAIAGEGIPVFFYGELAASQERRERSFFRRGGIAELKRRLGAGEIHPDLGPGSLHPTGGATLVSARPPLAAFNLVVEGLDAEQAAAIAARARESGGGPEGLRAIAVELDERRHQISTNVHDPLALRLAAVAELIRRLAHESGGRLVEAEVVGLVPAAALEGFPEDLPISGFDPDRQVLERRLAS